jgi:hypothetical protein
MTDDEPGIWADQPLPDGDIDGLLESGVPPEAIRPDRTLDTDLLRQLGWTVTTKTLIPPDDERHRELAQRNAERALNDPRTRRGYR